MDAPFRATYQTKRMLYAIPQRIDCREIAAAVQNIAPRIVSILCCNVSIRLNQLDHVALQIQNIIICLEVRSVR